MHTYTGTLKIPPSLPDYSLQTTLTSGQTFRWLTTDHTETPSKPLSNPTTDTFHLPTTIHSQPIIYTLTQEDDTIHWTAETNADTTPSQFKAQLKTRLGFNYDYADAITNLQSVDKRLATDIETQLSLICDPPFETTISFICSPQASIDRIYRMQRNIERQYGQQVQSQFGTFYIFPTISQLSNATEPQLKDCNLGYRASYVTKTISKLQARDVSLPDQNTNITTDSLTSQLQELVGVGEKVADCIALYGYNRTEIIPIDTRIQQMVQTRYDETASTPSKAKQVLYDQWGKTHAGYYQLLLYELAATEL